MDSLYEILYISSLSPGCSPGVVGPILQTARRSNTQTGITGVLVFDGQHFAQLFEGEKACVLQLYSALEHDDRHCGITLLHHGPKAQRRFKDFRMGYVDLDDIDAITRLAHLDGDTAVQAFCNLVPSLDMGIAVAA